VSLNTKSFPKSSSKQTIYTLVHITDSILQKNTAILMNMLLCRWSSNSEQLSILAKYVLQNIKQYIFLNITAQYMSHNICQF